MSVRNVMSDCTIVVILNNVNRVIQVVLPALMVVIKIVQVVKLIKIMILFYIHVRMYVIHHVQHVVEDLMMSV